MWGMFKKIINSESKTIASAAAVLAITSLTSRLIGMMRDRILASTFGAGPQLDIYYAAFRIPDFVYNLLILGALSAGFIPVFTEALIRGKQDRSEAWRISNGVVTLLAIIVIGILIVVSIFASHIVPFVAPGFPQNQLAQTVLLTRIMFLSPLFLGASAVFGGILQSFKRFFIYSLGPIFYNIGIILGALVFARWWGLAGLAWGVVLGAFLHMTVQFVAAYETGYRFTFVWAPGEKFVKEIMVLMLPRTLGLAVTQINLFVMTMIASTLQSGSISIFNLANNLQSAAVGTIGVSFAIAAFPSLVLAVARGDKEKVIQQFGVTVRQVLLFILPAMVLLLLLRAQIVRVVLGSGAFDWNATRLTADTLAFFTLTLVTQSLEPLLTRAFYAYKDTLTIFMIGLVSEGTTVAVALWLRIPLGVRGLALAESAGSIANFVLLLVVLRQRLGTLGGEAMIRPIYKMATATIAMAVVVQALKTPLDMLLNTQTLLGIFGQGFIAGSVGLVVYVGVGILLKSEDIILFATSARRKFFKNFAPQESVDEATGP